MLKKGLPILLVLLLSLIVGCGQDDAANNDMKSGNDNTATTKIPEYDMSKALTLKVYQSSANITDDEFNDLIAEPVKKKFPNVTMELVRPQAKVSREDLISTGEFPDMIYTNTTVIQEYLDLQLMSDLNPQIKKYSYDVGRFQQRYLDDIKAYTDKGQLFGLPFSTNFDVIYYNKDIFDKFAVPYPKDGMTWDETIELGRRLTKEVDGVKYEGIYPTLMRYFSTQLTVPFVNPKSLKAELTTNEWKRVFETYKAISDASGGIDPNNVIGRFNNTRTLAMMVHYGARVGELEKLLKAGKPLNWDMASYPAFKEKPGISQGADTHYLMISTTTKQAEAAFNVLAYLTGDEAQMNLSRKARLSALKDPKFREQFGADVQTLQGKNIQAIFKSTPAPLPIPTKYDGAVKSNLQKYAGDYLSGKGDVNTILRQLEDAVNKQIDVLKQAN